MKYKKKLQRLWGRQLHWEALVSKLGNKGSSCIANNKPGSLNK